MSSIRLNFINQSQDTGNSTVVIFQKNEADPDTGVAWRVIQNCGRGDNHPFTFSAETYIAASDSYGNYTPQLPAAPGQQFSMVSTDSGDQVVYKGPSVDGQEIELVNDLAQGRVDGWIYRDDQKLAGITGIGPGHKAVFIFNPIIRIGVVSQVVEGEIMDSAIISDINNQLSLLGIKKANIIMTGGGAGSPATPFLFSLANVEYA